VEPAVLMHELTLLPDCERDNIEVLALRGFLDTWADGISSFWEGLLDPPIAIALLGRCNSFCASVICTCSNADRDEPVAQALLGLIFEGRQSVALDSD